MSWILTFHTILTARMGSFEVRAAAKLKDFISLSVNGLLGGKGSKEEGCRRLSFYFLPLFRDQSTQRTCLLDSTQYELIEMATPQVKRMKNTLITSDFLIFYMNRRNRLLCDIANKFSKEKKCLTLSLIFSSLLYIQQLVIITVGISNE